MGYQISRAFSLKLSGAEVRSNAKICATLVLDASAQFRSYQMLTLVHSCNFIKKCILKKLNSRQEIWLETAVDHMLTSLRTSACFEISLQGVKRMILTSKNVSSLKFEALLHLKECKKFSRFCMLTLAVLFKGGSIENLLLINYLLTK